MSSPTALDQLVGTDRAGGKRDDRRVKARALALSGVLCWTAWSQSALTAPPGGPGDTPPPERLIFGTPPPLPPAAESASEPTGGAPGPPTPPADAEGKPVKVDKLRLEWGRLLDRGQGVESGYYAHGAISREWRFGGPWELRLAGRLDGYGQTGEPEVTELDLDYGESYLRYRGEHSRVTLGTQTVLWGRVDEIPPLDRLSVLDLRRFYLDDLAERRLAVGAVRWEGFWGRFKGDALFIPRFRAAKLPERDSIWSPVDLEDGRVLGFKGNPLLRELVRRGRFGKDREGMGGGGIRLNWHQHTLDYSISAQRVPLSAPYYALNDAVRRRLLAGATVDAALAATGPTFVEKHPWTWVAGGDLARETGGAIWRLEVAYLSAFPVTTEDLGFATEPALDWVGGVEFFPGDGDIQINLQLAGHHLLGASAVLDRRDAYSWLGRYQQTLAHQRWRLRLRWLAGVDAKDIYLNPELAYLGWEPHQVYLAMHYFEGAPQTLGGFQQDHSLVTLGWRVEF